MTIVINKKTYEAGELVAYVEKLEKERAELQETLKTYNGCGDWDNDFHTCRVYLQHEELQELQKENAELKEELKDANEKVVNLACNQNKDLKDKITKAIEIIKEYMRFEPMIGTCAFYSEEYEKTKKKAKQFLKEE